MWILVTSCTVQSLMACNEVHEGRPLSDALEIL